MLDVSKLSSSVLDTSMTSTGLFSLGGFQRSNSLDDNYSIIGSIPEEGEVDGEDCGDNDGWVTTTGLEFSKNLFKLFQFQDFDSWKTIASVAATCDNHN